METQRQNGHADDSPLLSRVRSLCLSLPETTEASSWGHPNFRAGKRTFVAYEWLKKRPSIAFRLRPSDVARYAGTPGFFLTAYGRGQWVRLEADRRVNWRLAKALILESYRLVALKRMTQALDGGVSRRSRRHAGWQSLEGSVRRLRLGASDVEKLCALGAILGLRGDPQLHR